MRELVAIRNFSLEDIPFVLDYWYRSGEAFLTSLGVDLAKLPTEAEMRAHLETLPQTVLTVLYDGDPIGMHTLTHVTEGESGIFHAHFWRKDLRGKGIGRISYVKALQSYFERFSLQRVEFRTPLHNIAPNRVKEFLGIRILGESITKDYSFVCDGIGIRIYEITRDELETLC